MEPYSLGASYFNDYRFDPSITANTVNRTVSPAGGGQFSAQNFAEILEKAAAQNAREVSLQNAEPPLSSPPANNKAELVSAAPAIDKNDKLYQQCLELETFLVKNLLTSMRNTIQKSGLINEGFAGKMYEDMLYDEYAKDLAKNANFGLAEQAYLQLKRYSF